MNTIISHCLLAPLVKHCSIFTQTGIFPETSMSSATHFSTSAIVPAGRTSVIEGPLSYVSSFGVGDVCLFIDDVTINDSLRPGDTQWRGEPPSRTHHNVSLLFIKGPLSYVSSFGVGDVCVFIDDVTINDSLRPGDTQWRGDPPSRTHHTVSLLFINVITTTVQVHNLNDDCTDRVTTLFACYVKLLLPCFSKWDRSRRPWCVFNRKQTWAYPDE